MKIEIAAKTERGRVRSTNQDNFRISKIDRDTYACVVCDGMGGASGGSEASCIAAVSFMDCLKELCAQRDETHNPESILKESLDRANSAVLAYSFLHPELEGMGTTLVGFILFENDLSWINVGDSRLYAASEDGLFQISSDHSLVNELVASGEMSEEEARSAEIGNIITRAVGVDYEVEADISTICGVFDKYRYILLCSDGLTNMLGREEIYKILTADACPQRKIDLLLANANRSGGYDNITAVLLAVTE